MGTDHRALYLGESSVMSRHCATLEVSNSKSKLDKRKRLILELFSFLTSLSSANKFRWKWPTNRRQQRRHSVVRRLRASEREIHQTTTQGQTGKGAAGEMEINFHSLVEAANQTLGL